MFLRHAVVAVAGVAALVVSGACEPNAQPMPLPSATVTPTPLPPTPEAVPLYPQVVPLTMTGGTSPEASVQITDVGLIAEPKGTDWYVPSLTLSETSGSTGATLTRLAFRIGRWTYDVTNDMPLGQGCLLTAESRRVPAGGTWKSSSIYIYCLDPDQWRYLSGSPVEVSVEYVDDANRMRQVTAQAVVPNRSAP